MLADSFYFIDQTRVTGGLVHSNIRFNGEHDIFHGHFPTVPVVPGVCMLQIIKEQLEMHTGRKLGLRSSSMMKFLAVINPHADPVVDVKVKFELTEPGVIRAEATISQGTRIFFKLTKAMYADSI